MVKVFILFSILKNVSTPPNLVHYREEARSWRRSCSRHSLSFAHLNPQFLCPHLLAVVPDPSKVGVGEGEEKRRQASSSFTATAQEPDHGNLWNWWWFKTDLLCLTCVHGFFRHTFLLLLGFTYFDLGEWFCSPTDISRLFLQQIGFQWHSSTLSVEELCLSRWPSWVETNTILPWLSSWVAHTWPVGNTPVSFASLACGVHAEEGSSPVVHHQAGQQSDTPPSDSSHLSQTQVRSIYQTTNGYQIVPFKSTSLGFRKEVGTHSCPPWLEENSQHTDRWLQKSSNIQSLTLL